MNAPLCQYTHRPPDTLPALAGRGPRALRLGEVLVEDGALSPGELDQALQLQLALDAPIGEILASQGKLPRQKVAQALARSHGTAFVDLSLHPPDPRLAGMIPAQDCLEHKTVIWRKEGAMTILACADPRKAATLLRRLPDTLRPARLALADEAAVNAAITTLYRADLTQLAEQRTPQAQSCRGWSGRRMAGIGLMVLLGLVLAGPFLVSKLLFWAAVATLAINTGLKLLCLGAALRRRRPVETTNRAVAEVSPRLPKISILVPLFREARIAETLITRLQRIDYPAPLLDICLVTEADDHMTQAALARTTLPHGMSAVTVPIGTLKTKPRAMNYALDFTSGSIVGVYDAEDAPDPDQLRKVALTFGQSDAKLACLQGVLSFYNPRAGWLARCFSFEYAAWFRVMLPGLQRLGFAIPLGGTTLFFRRDALVKLGGWDAHNVTEDADLGMRLARFGYRSEMIDTVTHEEANNRLWPWVRQRSRWLKGYAMTWCVHMRNPVRLWRDLGTRKFVGFQLLFLGTLLSFCLAPVLWWGFAHFVSGGFVPPPAGLTPAQISALTVGFLACEGVSLGVYLAAGRKLTRRPSYLWVFTLPAYFMLATLAAYKGIFEMLRRPFFWDKTEHGVSPAEPSELAGRIDHQPGLIGNREMVAQRLAGSSGIARLNRVDNGQMLVERDLPAPIHRQ